jgi:hypothetical protein
MAMAVAAMQHDVVGPDDLENGELSNDDDMEEGECGSDEDEGDLWEAVETMAFTDLHRESNQSQTDYDVDAYNEDLILDQGFFV